MISIRQWAAGAALFLTCAGAAWAQPDAKSLYLSKCAACHGADGAGETAKGKKLKMKGVKETSAKMTAVEMAHIVDAGKGADMDAFGKQLTKEQIEAIVGYYRSLGQ